MTCFVSQVVYAYSLYVAQIYFRFTYLSKMRTFDGRVIPLTISEEVQVSLRLPSPLRVEPAARDGPGRELLFNFVDGAPPGPGSPLRSASGSGVATAEHLQAGSSPGARPSPLNSGGLVGRRTYFGL